MTNDLALEMTSLGFGRIVAAVVRDKVLVYPANEWRFVFIEVVVQQPGIVVVKWLTRTYIGEENSHYSSPYGAVSHRIPASAWRDGDVRFDMRAAVGDSEMVVLAVSPVLAIGIE